MYIFQDKKDIAKKKYESVDKALKLSPNNDCGDDEGEEGENCSRRNSRMSKNGIDLAANAER